nr:hypothetical protein [Candidatus Prometheoarchaeum syntrophicum]
MSNDTSEDFLAWYNRSPNSVTTPSEEMLCAKNLDLPSKCPRCEICLKALRKRFKTHINTCQEPQEHHFCSRECKELWCQEMRT